MKRHLKANEVQHIKVLVHKPDDLSSISRILWDNPSECYEYILLSLVYNKAYLANSKAE